MDAKDAENIESRAAALMMAQWFRDNKVRAFVGHGLYRVKMSEEWYDGLTTLFENLAAGKLVSSSALAEKEAEIARLRDALEPFKQEAAARGWLVNHDGGLNELIASGGIGGSALQNRHLYNAYIALLPPDAPEPAPPKEVPGVDH